MHRSRNPLHLNHAVAKGSVTVSPDRTHDQRLFITSNSALRSRISTPGWVVAFQPFSVKV
jgi:hypothetical protein